MKIIQWILIALIFLSPYKANASRDSDSYDGNIFPIYAGNGAIVPPQTTLQESKTILFHIEGVIFHHSQELHF